MSTYCDFFSKCYHEQSLQFHVNPKKCENPCHYDTYLSQAALTDYKSGLGTTYIFVNEKDGTKDIMGFITLRASSLILDIGETNKMGYPALEISELAVDERYEKNGVGSDLVKFAINLSYDLNKQIGIQYVVLCADPMAVGFYENPELKFEKIPTHCGKSLPRENWNKNCTPMIKKLMHEQHVDQNKRTA